MFIKKFKLFIQNSYNVKIFMSHLSMNRILVINSVPLACSRLYDNANPSYCRMFENGYKSLDIDRFKIYSNSGQSQVIIQNPFHENNSDLPNEIIYISKYKNLTKTVIIGRDVNITYSINSIIFPIYTQLVISNDSYYITYSNENKYRVEIFPKKSRCIIL